MKEKVLVYATVFLLAVALIAGASIYATSSQTNLEKARQEATAVAGKAERPLPKVKIWRVFEQPLIDVLKLPGAVEAYQDIDLAARMSGTIEWIGPREGDLVKAGEKLLQLDVAALAADVAQRRAAYELAELKFKRVADLYKKQVVAVDEYDDSEAQVKTSKAALDAVETTLSYGTLYSPIDGALDWKPLEPGEHVNAGQTVMRIVDSDPVRIVLNVPEKDALCFRRGQTAAIHFSNGQEREFSGIIDFVAMTADPATHTYPVKVLVENPDGLLRPGMIVRASLARRQIEKAIAVPFFTIIDREDSKAVFVVEDGVAHERPIKYGVIQNGLVEIVEGLNSGAPLVVVGHRNLVEGEKVEVAEDVTEASRAMLASGGDLSNLAMEFAR